MTHSEGHPADDLARPGLPVHHVGIAVHSLEHTTPVLERLTGASGSRIEILESQRVRVCFVGVLELLEPTDPDSTVARFLARRGQGMHHIAYATPDIRAALARLVADGFEAIDLEPRPGAQGHRVAFLHPKSTEGVLVELVEVSEERATGSTR